MLPVLAEQSEQGWGPTPLFPEDKDVVNVARQICRANVAEQTMVVASLLKRRFMLRFAEKESTLTPSTQRQSAALEDTEHC